MLGGKCYCGKWEETSIKLKDQNYAELSLELKRTCNHPTMVDVYYQSKQANCAVTCSESNNVDLDCLFTPTSLNIPGNGFNFRQLSCQFTKDCFTYVKGDNISLCEVNNGSNIIVAGKTIFPKYLFILFSFSKKNLFLFDFSFKKCDALEKFMAMNYYHS